MHPAIRFAPIAPVGVFVAVFLLYAPSFDALFAVLDFNHLDAIRSTDASTYFLRIFDPSNGGRTVIGTGDLYRPIYYSVFWLEYQAFGTDPMPYYIFNATLHGANAVLVYLLAKRLTGSMLASVTGALIWGFHPQYADAIAWVSSTTDLLLVFFGLTAVLCYAKALDMSGGGRAGMFVASFCAALLALGAKETGAVVVVIIAGYHLLIGDPAPVRERRVPWQLAPFLAIPLVYFPLRAAMVGNLAADGGNEIFSLRPFANIHVLASYAAGPLVGDITAAHELSVAQGAAGIVVVVTAAAGAILASRRGWFLGGWTLVAMTPVLIFPEVWLVGRYMYLPFVGVAILAGLGIAQAAALMSRQRFDLVRAGAGAVAVAGLIVWLGPLNVDHQHWVTGKGEEAGVFLARLKATYPELPDGRRLIVTEHPRSLSFAENDGMMLGSAVRISYERDVEVVTPWHFGRGQPPATERDLWYPPPVEPISLDASDVDP